MLLTRESEVLSAVVAAVVVVQPLVEAVVAPWCAGAEGGAWRRHVLWPRPGQPTASQPCRASGHAASELRPEIYQAFSTLSSILRC
jgi:hypothetical protein